jgi:hypothetical protein
MAQADLYAQMGIAAILPGLTRAVEIMQSEIDSLRAMLATAAQGGRIIKRPGRPPGIHTKQRKKQAHANGSVPVPTVAMNVKGKPIRTDGPASYWAKMTPEERSAEMKRRQKLAAKRSGQPTTTKSSKAARAGWAKLSKKAKADRVAAMNAARLAKRAAAQAEARLQ